ncbi:radial spoke head protein 9 homolog [Stegodyphus dumicola]|uniref:radial spoke head protein 9 homolog n=1 Tax=Stegodyphus dumicola TaxID=202533 RepID=UPI0015ABB1D1|nr:radial spoke head protein 9 homolog [Stegodyphus dumicola]
MLKDRLNLNMDNFYSTGYFLTIEEQSILQLSLPILQQENKFTSVAFLGKIFGIKNDYYIAQGRGNDFIRNKMSFYSLDGNSWRVLFPPSREILSKFHLVRNRFIGDPSWIHRFYDVTAEEDYMKPDRKSAIKEEHRLSALVKLMDFETAIGPRNALMINPQGIVKKNPYFEGLSKTDAIELSSYLHFRLPDSDVSFAPTIQICPSGVDKALQFLEPISHDYPPGCWILQGDPLMEVITLRNLWWPGYTFYHKPETKEYNAIYIGYGERNDDLPFML